MEGNNQATYTEKEGDRCKFMSDFRISDADWDAASITWPSLLEIQNDHLSQMPFLSETAAYYGRWVQRMEGVHSVRWRVKHPAHLMAKIIRKKASARPGYAEISAENYFTIVTDLIGVRALHLFKDEFAQIHKQLTSYDFPKDKERPTAYHREGDDNGLANELGLQLEVHPERYRSIHYVKSSAPGGRQVYFEVQVRTIFEEGWSEVDHRVRYPNFSSNPNIAFSCRVLNTMAGAADELSTHIRNIAAQFDEQKSLQERSAAERDEAFERMQQLLGTVQGNEAIIEKLKYEVKDLKSALDQVRADQSLAAWQELNQRAGLLGNTHQSTLRALGGGAWPDPPSGWKEPTPPPNRILVPRPEREPSLSFQHGKTPSIPSSPPQKTKPPSE